jgi:hypothetical protein
MASNVFTRQGGRRFRSERAGLDLAIEAGRLEELREQLRYTRGGVSKVVERSLNRTIRGVRTDASREIRADVTIKDRFVKQTFRLHLASAKKGVLSAAIESRGGPVSLVAYDTRQTKRGVSVKVNRQGGREVIPHAFKAVVYGNEPAIYRRKIHTVRGGYSQLRREPRKRSPGQYAQMPRKYRFPVKKLFGPSVPSIFRREDVMARIKAKAQQRLETELTRQARYEIQRSGIEVERI